MAEITTVDQLRAVLGEPLERAATKDRSALEPSHLAFLAGSPFCLIASSATDGTCDVSPKGEQVGSFLAVDETTLAIPERPGNKRADGYVNIVSNPHVGLIFFIPGRGDTLRVNGRARLLTDAPYADRLTVDGHRPLMILEVAVEQTFFHCSKAFLRSKLWHPETWSPDAVPSRADIAHALERHDEPIEQIREYYESPSYGADLY